MKRVLRTGATGYIGSHVAVELMNAFMKVTGVNLNYKIAPRSPGDVEQYWADPPARRIQSSSSHPPTVGENPISCKTFIIAPFCSM